MSFVRIAVQTNDILLRHNSLVLLVPNRAYFSHVPLTSSEFQWAAAEGSVGGLVLGLWRKPL